MSISRDEISTLEAVVNAKLRARNMSFQMSVHFVKDRMNDPRNIPGITIAELQGIFSRLFALHINEIAKLNHKDSFNIRCTKTDINMPCAVSKEAGPDRKVHQQNIVITIMRKKDFRAKDPLEFRV